MKKTADISVSTQSRSFSLGSRNVATDCENELNVLLDRIHALYSGSLSAFFTELEKSERQRGNGTRKVSDRNLVGTK